LALEPVSVASSDAATILALNSGSSSLKFGLYRVSQTETEMLFSGEAESIGEEKGDFHARDAGGNTLLAEKAALPGPGEAIARIAGLLRHFKMPPPDAVGHRVVHGGPELRQHCLIDAATIGRLEAARAFAPLHTPAALAVIRAAQRQFPEIPHMACFDTAFHADLPDVARILPLPKELRSEGIQRYGFHGLSCESILSQLGDDMPERLIVAHLGNGASITAIRAGKSIDTSMGLTPTGGVIMGTRPGDLDPGVLIYLMREKTLDATQLEELVDHRSGLLGISGVSSDLRSLHERAPVNADARLAIDMFCYSVRKQIAAMTAALDGVDLIVFTGGIGENDAAVRAEVCDGLSWLGVTLDAPRNRIAGNPINDPASRCSVRVLASQEDAQIARHCRELLGRNG
jgi:acetate kinase